MRRRALIARSRSQPLSFVEHTPGLAQPAAFDKRGADLGKKQRPPWIITGEKLGNPLEQADRRGQIAADERPSRRCLEAAGRLGG